MEEVIFTIKKARIEGFYNITCNLCGFINKFGVKGKDLYSEMIAITELFNNEYNKAVLFEVE